MSALLLLLATGVAAQEPDSKGCKDHPMFPTRMPEYRLEACKVEDFGVYEFFTTKGPKIPVEGKFTFISYAFTGQRTNEPSGLAVVRDHGIAPARLRAYGCGPFAPVASNDTEEGRAKNRRVELVKQ